MFRRSITSSSPPSAAKGGGLIDSRYELERPLGSGGMAQVWQVVDRTSGQQLALKRLSSHAERRAVARFEREYYTLTTLHHPNIVEVYDYGSDADGPYYTMELLRGSDVSNLAPLPWPEVCRVLRDIASGLALIHARRYVHRDISARNVWQTPDAQLKLIDFGTLAPFGKRSDVAGTPPYIAPEALHGRELDQRTDLYSLGALGYWLLTGLHAFPARSLHVLDQMWQQRPRAPSHRVAELKRKDLPEVPRALDAVIETLLSMESRGRLNDAAAVIDTVCAIAGLQSEDAPLVVSSYLETPVLVGRGKTLDVLTTALERAQGKRGASVILEGPASMGRSRLLSELAVQARLVSATVLDVEAGGEHSPNGVAEQFARKLLDALPVAASAAARPQAAVLGHLSPALRERLEVAESDLAVLPKAHGEARMRIQAALADWFVDVARDHTLVLLADDLHAFDVGSIAWLTALGRQGRSCRLLIVATLRSDEPGPSAIDAFRRHATVISLAPLTPRDTEAMLRSMFGDVPHLRRLSELVTQRAEGNPGDTIDLVAHLAQQGVVKYAAGAWVLPTQIAAEDLPLSPGEVHAARLGRLSQDARDLGRALSVRDGMIPLEACQALSELPMEQTLAALEVLVREGVLVGSAEGYRFTREAARDALRAELDELRLQRVHRISGDLILQAASAKPLEQLEGGLHLLLGGDYDRGTEVVARAGLHYALGDLAETGQAAPALERALEIFKKLDRKPHELLSLYAPLALAGYYAERRYADRYGEPALELLQQLLGLHRARRLQKFLGRKLGLYVALGSAAYGFWKERKNPRVANFRSAMLLLFYCASALTGVCAVCIDSVKASQYARVLEPLRALGRDHVATLMHDFCVNLSLTVQDRIGFVQARWQKMIGRLDRGGHFREMTEDVRILYLAGALYASGVIETWRDASKALQYAQRLEDFKLRLYELSASQLRMLYHAHQGDFTQSEMHRERVEVHAIQRGTAWQAETWAFGALITVYARVHDAIGVKHCMQQLQQQSRDVPSLARLVKLARGTQFAIRGVAAETVALLDTDEQPLVMAGWARSRGILAHAYSLLGQHQRARDICVDAETRLSPVDFDYPAMTLSVLIEHAIADASLGDHAAACAQLDDLIRKHGPLEGPLTLSALHDARLKVAALMRDVKAVEYHIACMQRWQRVTNIPSLIAYGVQSAKEAREVAGCPLPPEPDREQDSTASPEQQSLTIVHRIRHGGERSLHESAAWILDQLSTYADLRAGHVFRWENERLTCVASTGVLPDPEVFEMWLMQRLWNDDTDEEQTVQLDRAMLPGAEREQQPGPSSEPGAKSPPVASSNPVPAASATPAPAAKPPVAALSIPAVAGGDTFIAQDRSYRMIRLVTSPSSGSRLVGVLVLSEETQCDIPPTVLRVIAERVLASAADAELST